MITKECEVKKYCCFYVSDFHLEMILLPYIKDNIDKSKFIILTEKNLVESIKILLERTNLNCDEKIKMLDLNWNSKTIGEISNLNFKDHTIIINGSSDYICKINEEIMQTDHQKLTIIDCYNVSEESLKVMKIQEKYDGILNTKKL